MSVEQALALAERLDDVAAIRGLALLGPITYPHTDKRGRGRILDGLRESDRRLRHLVPMVTPQGRAKRQLAYWNRLRSQLGKRPIRATDWR